jgi:plastocyanin
MIFRSPTCRSHAGFSGVALLVLALLAISTHGGTRHDVNVWSHLYEPELLDINVGDTVVWTAWGSDHSVVANEGRFDSATVFDSGLPVFAEFKFTFHEPGTYAYYCVNHPQMLGTVTVVGSGPTNQVPFAPVNLQPAAGATNVAVAGRVELRGSPFNDADLGDAHPVSQWLVRESRSNRPVYDSGAVNSDGRFTNSRTNFFLPAGLLGFGTAYAWQVRHKDAYGDWSPYSAATVFTTQLPTLAAVKRGTNVVVSWPTNAPGFALEYATNFPAAWKPAAPTPAVVSGENVVTNGLGETLRIYRLNKP